MKKLLLCLAVTMGCSDPPASIVIECHTVPVADGFTIQCGNDNSQNNTDDVAEPPRADDTDAGVGGASPENTGFYFCYQYPPYPSGASCNQDEDCPDPQSPCVFRVCGANKTCVGAFAPLGAKLCGDGALVCSSPSCCGWIESLP